MSLGPGPGDGFGLAVRLTVHLPELTAEGARYPLGPDGLADALGQYLDEFGLATVDH